MSWKPLSGGRKHNRLPFFIRGGKLYDQRFGATHEALQARDLLDPDIVPIDDLPLIRDMRDQLQQAIEDGDNALDVQIQTLDDALQAAVLDVSGLQTQVDAKADADHGHTIDAITGLQEELDTIRSIGIGQSWQDVTSSRMVNVTYTNTTGRTIAIAIDSSGNGSTGGALLVDGMQVCWGTANPQATPFFSIIPPGSTYRFNHTSFTRWTELR